MQIAIDNAKRRSAIDLNEEIARIKEDSSVDINKKPSFWFDIKKKDKFSKRMTAKEKNEKKKKLLNSELTCPMNYLGEVKFDDYRSPDSTLGMENFFVKYDLELNRRKSKRVEEIIEKYSLQLYSARSEEDEDDMYDEYLLLREDFDQMVEDIKKVYMSDSYLGLMSWLIDRAFCITVGAQRNQSVKNSKIHKNKSLLLKVLYDINKENLLKIFSKGIGNSENLQ